MRKNIGFHISDLHQFRKNVAVWASSFPLAAVFDSNKEHTDEPGYRKFSAFDILVGVSEGNDSVSVQKLPHKPDDWHFGHISYESLFATRGLHEQKDGFSPGRFFVPDWVIEVHGNQGIIHFKTVVDNKLAEMELKKILNTVVASNEIQGRERSVNYPQGSLYSENVRKIQQHIARGDIYEMNYCLEFFAEQFHMNPSQVWIMLNEFSPAPFSAFYRNFDSWLISASPERFLKKQHATLVSQPIKGTIARSQDIVKDVENQRLLLENRKERSENIMITDLVRNDLARVSKIDSVRVEELCRLYSFKHVHQLISTISSVADENLSVSKILEAMFPMGSMTGAPKLNAIKLAAEFENFNRGLYSGSVGYVDPDGNFDFNVVIRSILYNRKTARVSLPAGSAITMESIPDKEYEECMVKISPLLKILHLRT